MERIAAAYFIETPLAVLLMTAGRGSLLANYRRKRPAKAH